MINIRNGMINKDLLELTILLKFKKFFDQDLDTVAEFMLDENVFGDRKSENDSSNSFLGGNSSKESREEKKKVIKECLLNGTMPMGYNIDSRYQEDALKSNASFIVEDVDDKEKFTKLLSAVAMQWAIKQIWEARYDSEETKKYKGVEDRQLAWLRYEMELKNNPQAKRPPYPKPTDKEINENNEISKQYSPYTTANFGEHGKQYIAIIGLVSSDDSNDIKYKEEIENLERVNLVAYKEDSGHIEYKVQYCNSNILFANHFSHKVL